VSRGHRSGPPTVVNLSFLGQSIYTPPPQKNNIDRPISKILIFGHRKKNSCIARKQSTSLQDNHKAYLDLWNRIMGMHQQIAYSQNATRPVQNTADDNKCTPNQTLQGNLKVPFIRYVIQEKSIYLHDKLGNYSNPILQPLLEQQQRRRLKKLWPADLIDG
jgi:hypothetical protein